MIKNGTGNINMEENKKDGEKGSSGAECCLSKIEKLGDLGASHCTNNRCRGSNIHEGSGTGTIGAHGGAMTASSIMDITGTWCNKFS